jgi:transcriptional regulator with XRE-family HTH domain
MVTKDQVRDARLLLRWTARELAEKAGVRRETIQRIETGKVDIEKSNFATIMGIRGALEAGGIEFLEDGSVRRKLR